MSTKHFSLSNYIDIHDLGRSAMATVGLFLIVLLSSQAYAATVTLSVVVQTSFTFNTTTDNFSTITPGTIAYATTTLQVTTNTTNGWTVSLSGDNKNNQPQSNLQLVGATSTQITDQTEWVNNAATTSPGNAALAASFINSANVLAFRVRTASSTNGAAFISTSWWGTDDAGANALWAGISSSTVARLIGNAGVGSYSSSIHINTVNYYLNVASSQRTGTYSAPITYTGTGNP